jgi:hypothetical protein|tara:strand:+ start:500 stop:994 length:495 start_codon:yes stop_codon:yes gene_type:complete
MEENMTDLTQYNGGQPLDTNDVESSGGGGSLEPGRYNLHYAGHEMMANDKGWEGMKIIFEVDGTTINVNSLFTLKHPKEDVVVRGTTSLKLFGNAAGINSIKSADQFLGKTVSADLIRGEKGYLEIDEQYGRTWGMPLSKEEAKEEVKKEAKDDDSEISDAIPF